VIELLASWDRGVFTFINQTMANPVFDLVMPALTDWNKSVIGWLIAGTAWLLLVLRGGKKGRIVAVLVLFVVGASDQLSSQVLKNLFARARPCHDAGGVPVMAGLRLLVDCGSGYSFPSSHAVNNTALAVFLATCYRRWTWVFALYALLMGLSRVVVGVHYPSDVLGGALIGAAIGYAFALLWKSTARHAAILRIDDHGA
jgi:undecaprenyl-diphosphatase